MSIVKHTYNFRTISAPKLQSLPDEIDGSLDVKDAATVAEHFETVEADDNGNGVKFKRKPVTVELELPEFVNQLPDELSKNLIRNYIADFVKSSYVDNFIEVGPHDWETIVKESQASRGGSTISIGEAVLNLTAEHFGKWVAADTGSEELGKRVTALVSGKVSQASITKQLNQCNVEVLDKLAKRADGWAEYVAESGDENAEELAQGYDFIMSRLDKLKRKFTNNVADLVDSVL